MGVDEVDIPADFCSVEGCEKPRETRGWCGKHYREWLYSEDGQAAKRYKKTQIDFRPPDREIDRAYLAGLIDGDGSITRFAPKRGYWNIKIYMMDREVIDWLQAYIGGTTSTYQPKNRIRRVYQWHLSRQAHVRLFLMAVSPYLKVHAKQARAREALSEIEDKANARLSKGVPNN